MDETTKAMLARMPLAEAVLWLWRWITDEERLVRVWEAHRGRCYQKVISFAVIVQLMADALLEYGGSGRRSFEKGVENGELEATIQAAYRKLGRLPLPLSEAFLAESATALRTMFPRKARRKLPKSLSRFQVIILDGKAIKKVAKRLAALRGVKGGLLGGRALVALDWRTGLAVAMRVHPDGQANEVALVGELVPEVRKIVDGARLWLSDRAFCDLTQPAHFTQRGDHYLVRYHRKVSFYPDPKRPLRTGRDKQGRTYTEQWGWLGGPADRRRQEVRMITLPKVTDGGKKDLVLVTDLLDGEDYPAADLLALYAERWGIENMFQQVTEVFGLAGLIGGTPQACLFQFAFCLLLYNLIQVIRAYVAEAQNREMESLSSEKLFDDVQRELIAWNVMLDAGTTVDYFEHFPNAETLHTRLETLLASTWSDTWIKSPKPTKRRCQTETKKKPTHDSVYRLLEKHRRRTRRTISSA
jgi:hypothetical protein